MSKRPIEMQALPVLQIGDAGPAVAYMQSLLPHGVDGDFGPITEEEVRDFQRWRGLVATGICDGPTWEALETGAPPMFPSLPASTFAAIVLIASTSTIADYSWADRGKAPEGYMQGMALAFAQSYLRLRTKDPAVVEMAKPNTHDGDVDALAWFAAEFEALEMSNEGPGQKHVLRHLYMLLLGLGMRESSGRHCEGRDLSAENTSAETAEAGLFQTSYDAHGCHPTFDPLMDEFLGKRLAGFIAVFANGVSCSDEEWGCYGSGRGYEFQQLCKDSPAFAVESCALTLRNRRQHYGPINRKEAELRPEADAMFRAVQAYIDWAMPEDAEA